MTSPSPSPPLGLASTNNQSLSESQSTTLRELWDCPSPLGAPGIGDQNPPGDASSNPSRRGGQIEINIDDNTQLFAPANHHRTEFHYKRGITYLVYGGALVVMYPSLTQLTQLKFQNNSPFETHAFLAYTTVVAFATAIPTSIILFFVKATQESNIKEYFNLIFYKILESVYLFFAILAPLSLVLLLLIPHEFNWIGYSIISALFVLILARTFTNYKNLQVASDLEVVQRNN